MPVQEFSLSFKSNPFFLMIYRSSLCNLILLNGEELRVVCVNGLQEITYVKCVAQLFCIVL